MNRYDCTVEIKVSVEGFNLSDVEDVLRDYFGPQEGDVEITDMKVVTCESD